MTATIFQLSYWLFLSTKAFQKSLYWVNRSDLSNILLYLETRLSLKKKSLEKLILKRIILLWHRWRTQDIIKYRNSSFLSSLLSCIYSNTLCSFKGCRWRNTTIGNPDHDWQSYEETHNTVKNTPWSLRMPCQGLIAWSQCGRARRESHFVQDLPKIHLLITQFKIKFTMKPGSPGP